jgi:molybdopterin-containing oxidoreductase family membrane subunit
VKEHFWLPREPGLNAACVAAFAGVWIEKGMGLIIPGFVPSTLHELVEYVPSMAEWKITAGIWAVGFMVLTIAIKIALKVLTGEMSVEPRSCPPAAASARR